uniref:Importin N-terminal domain-containing protein n=1 Tax=Strigamia maritima TaxID=126957 RepID=T1IKF5_STRMM
MNLETTLPIVLDTLSRATSQNPEILKPAEEQLKRWEIERGFYSVLLAVFSNHNIDVNVRWQAVIYFKNGVDRAISEDEKCNLRKLLLQNFNEPVNQIATQLAVLISKIARYDCPREWPELVPALLTVVKSEQELSQHRSLLTLHYVIKSLSSKRLAGDRRIFQELTGSILNFILNLYNTYTDSFLGGADSIGSLEKGLLALKIACKLVVHGIKEPHKVEESAAFINSVFVRLKTILDCRLLFTANDLLRERCEKYIILLTKVLMDVLENHPFSYVPFIKSSLELCVNCLFTNEGKVKLFERFTIHCLNLIKGIITCAEYRPAKDISQTKEPATLEAYRIICEFFTPPVLTEISRQLISQYFLLTEDDLCAWENDPEGFAADEGGEAWKFNLRPCTEVVFLSIFHEFRATLIPMLVELLRSNAAPCDPNNINMIFQKDAIYNAVGLAAFDLFDEIDFDEWFSKILQRELQIKDARYKIIRRRVIWLISQWVGVKLASDLRPLLYDSILALLSNEEDLVYLQLNFSLLFQLLQQVTEGETKMHVLHVLSFVIERVGSAIQPYTDGLIQYLPLLWNESADHNMLRCAILSTLVQLVQGLGPESEKLYPFLIPVIQLSTDLQQSVSVYLMEDGLELWLASLQNSSRMQNCLLSLCPNLIALLDTTSEHLKTCFQILQAYVLLCPEEFIQQFASIVHSCCSLVSETRSEGLVTIMKLVEVVLQTIPSQGAQLFQPLFAHVFKTVIKGEEYPMVMSMYLTIIARVLIADQNIFRLVLELVSNESGKMPEESLGKLLDVTFNKLPIVTQPERRKLLGLAITSFLSWPTNIVTDRICCLLLAVVEVLNDITRTDDAGINIDSLMIFESEDIPISDYLSEDVPETEHQRRKKLIALKDPVHTIVLKDFLHRHLLQLQQRIGAAAFKQLMQEVDFETMQQLDEYMKTC